ncbi:formylglycine-generating enzyme family protein [Variovorax sp. DT-64]
MPSDRLRLRPVLAGGAAAIFAMSGCGRAAAADPGIDWLPVGRLDVARTETTIGQFHRFVRDTGSATDAERLGGGSVFEAGWVQKPGWTWRAPFGNSRTVHDDEPAVHVTYDEAHAFCRWAGGRLPSDNEWVGAAYTEQRPSPPAPFVSGRTYPYPTGERPAGAQCLDDCGADAPARAVSHGARLWRGHGHARVSSTPPGVNGLHDMGGNAWEWVGGQLDGQGPDERLMRGGSWWYGAAQMRADHVQSKPGRTAVVYVGFRCVRDRSPRRQTTGLFNLERKEVP